MLALRMLGGLSVERDGTPCIKGAAARRKTLALLALLAGARRKGLGRDKVIAYLWPEADSAHGRNLLKQACFALRRDLHEPELFIGRAELRLNPAIITSDSEVLEAALAQGEHARAVALYSGYFLDGFYLRSAPEFERWVEAERAELNKRVCGALETLATVASVNGDHQSAVEWWRRLAALDPFNSRATLGLMTALAALGEVAEALQRGHAYETLVRQELGATPEAAVLELGTRLRLETAPAEGVRAEELQRAVLAAAPRRTVGYNRERAALQGAMDRAIKGRGSLVCVTGEPGSGKTTLVEDFLGEVLASGRPCHIARGRCSERLAGSGAYLPLLDALEGLLRGDSRGAVGHLMRQLAPNWYGQVAPAVLADAKATGLSVQAQAASQERLKRELDTFLHELCRLRLLVVFLDDVHWVDASTVDILAYVANRVGTAQLLLLASYRPAELLLGKHPFGPLKLDLQTRGLCNEVSLPLLTRDDIDRFLSLEFPNHSFPATFAEFLHAKTEGSPLFMVDLVRYLRAKGAVVAVEGTWRLGTALPSLEGELPESVRSMIERKLEQLNDADLRLLMTAGVQGYEFDSPIVARVLDASSADVEERLDRMDHVHGFVRPLREVEFPDGTPAARYTFVHVLYQNALYARLTPTRRASLSRAIAEALLYHYGERKREVAADLALLFEAARDIPRAVEFFTLAAEHAASIFAYQEVVVLAQRGLALIGTLPESPARGSQELTLQLRLGYALRVTKGYAAREPGACMARAREICQQLGDGAQLFTATWGLWGFHLVGGEVRAARQMAEELLRMGNHTGDPIMLYGAHTTLATCLHYLGEQRASHDHSERAIALYDPSYRGVYRSLYRREPSVYTWGESLRINWFCGYPDQGLRRMHEAIALGREVAEPEMLAYAHCFAGQLHQYRGEPELAQAQAAACIALADEHGLAAQREWAAIVHGWAVAEQGAIEEGIAQLRDSLTAQRGKRLLIAFPWWYGLLAGALTRNGQFDDALAAIRDGLEITGGGDQPYAAAELLRLKGEILLACRTGGDAPEACLREAVATASRQQAKGLELRSAASLARLWQTQGRENEARQLLAPIYSWFTEGFDTVDLQEARLLLDRLS